MTRDHDQLPEDLPDRDDAVPFPVTDAIDLHAFHPRDIPALVADYLDAAAAEGFSEVRIIHGKGIGVQRDRVRQVLSAHPRVESYRDAPAERGHWGATTVRLRVPPPSSG
jgi:dsDNA-specific endonuclease/ATPase MutS2